ncbi:MAG: pentatricopeptide repeat-containing protein, partial [Planctomycetota bacterium]
REQAQPKCANAGRDRSSSTADSWARPFIEDADIAHDDEFHRSLSIWNSIIRCLIMLGDVDEAHRLLTTLCRDTPFEIHQRE